ncbi:FYVE, RhoGEF and PH domain-containing protein 4 [Gadus morhua]|uniref:FYVE, RhoGEF and PH domain-containing protein 4 n=1 Tax=Gadus morhua TaxID=8049 RepID=UPI0011B5ABCF|nr:FYVE, RhoGEF and PH domain-containing protein 4-like [Gadus morhua]
MFDLKKRHSLVLKVGLETEFRRVALRRRSRGAVEDQPSETVSNGVGGSYRQSGTASDHLSPQRRDQNQGSPLAPQVPPHPAPLQSPEKAFVQENLSPRGRHHSSVSSLVASHCPTGEGKPPSGQRARLAVLIQVIPAESLTSRSPAGTSPVRTPLLGVLSPSLSGGGGGGAEGGGAGGGGGGGAEGQSNPPSPSSGDAAHKPAKRRSPSLWKTRSAVWLRRSWSGQTQSGCTRKEERVRPRSAALQTLAPQTPDPRDGLSPPADPSECAPLTPSDPSTSGSLACKRKYHTDSETVVSFESRGLSKDPIPGPVVTGPAPVARGPGPVGPGPGPVALGPGPVGPGPGLRVGAGPELLHHSVGAQGPAGEGSEEDLTGLGVGRTHEDVGTHMDVEDKDQKESKRKEKLYQIATELLMTERAYVVRLHLLDQVFCSGLSEEASKGSFPLEVVRNLFSNIPSIHSFHSQFLLPDLEERMVHWWDRPALGDVLLRHAPFLRMYSEYVGNFEVAMGLLKAWRERSAAFRNVLLEIQSQEVCGRLSLEHHMLEPVQRVPRYEMLLTAYLTTLPRDDPDHFPAEKALEAIAMAAGHSNSAIHRAESLKKLLDIFEMVSEEEILRPSTEFLREGRLLKLAARNKSAMERYLFLFNDFLLCCTPRLVLVGQRYGARTRIGVEGMTVQRTTNHEHPHSFQVSGKEKTLELEASSEKERDEWIKVIQKAIDVSHAKIETLKLASKVSSQTEPEEELGRRAPRWTRDNEVMECMKCREAFNAFTRRRHHCRACGCVVCGKCSDHKVALEYDEGRLNKVCDTCHGVLSGQDPKRPRLPDPVGSLSR